MLGDVNSDGILNIADVVAMVNIILRISQTNEIELYSADINQDGIVNILDVISLVNILLNQVNKNKLEAYRTNYLWTKNLVDASLKNNIKWFIIN